MAMEVPATAGDTAWFTPAETHGRRRERAQASQLSWTIGTMPIR